MEDALINPEPRLRFCRWRGFLLVLQSPQRGYRFANNLEAIALMVLEANKRP